MHHKQQFFLRDNRPKTPYNQSLNIWQMQKIKAARKL